MLLESLNRPGPASTAGSDSGESDQEGDGQDIAPMEDVFSDCNNADSEASDDGVDEIEPRAESPRPSEQSSGVGTGEAFHPSWQPPQARQAFEGYNCRESETVPLSPFFWGLAAWADQIGLSRSGYKSLRELAMLSTVEDWRNLPLTLDTLLDRYEKNLPCPSIYGKSVPVQAQKLPTGSQFFGMPTAEVYFVDAINTVRTILNCAEMRNKMHFGMAELVDNPQELWHGQAWAQSILSCSGDAARINGTLVFPSDCVRYRCPSRTGNLAIGRVRAIFKDCRSHSSSQGKVVLQVERITPVLELDKPLRQLLSDHEANDAVLMEDAVSIITVEEATERIPILFDRTPQASNGVSAAASVTRSNTGLSSPRYTVRYIINGERRTARLLRLSHPIRAELKIECYTRDALERQLINRPGAPPVYSLPILTFIDAFGVYRNMYRSLTGKLPISCVLVAIVNSSSGIYMILGSLPLHERSRLENMYPITLGPHGSDIEDVLGSLEAASKELERGVLMDLQFDAEQPGHKVSLPFISTKANE